MSRRQKTKKENRFSAYMRSNALMILVILLVAAYIAVSCISVLNVKLETQTALPTTVYKTVNAEALVVRNETVLQNEGSSVIVPSVDDGEKVAKNGEVAMAFSSSENASLYSEYTEYQNEIEYYAAMENKTIGQVSDVESVDEDIVNALDNYIQSISDKYDSDAAEKAADTLNDKITTRQILIGQDVDFSGAVKEITEKMNAINLDSCQPTSVITTDVSGTFSSYTDSLESAFPYDDITSVNEETLTKYINEAKNAAADTASFGKLITDFTWYICADVPTEDVEDLSDGDSVEITLSESNEVLKCKIISGAEDTTLGQENTVLILSCDEMNSELAKLRLCNIDIRVGEYTGIMVPADAVHMQDGEKGVYVLISSVVTWRNAEIKYTGDNYVILSYSNETDNGIILYDEIIINGKDLSDGKVYT